MNAKTEVKAVGSAHESLVDVKCDDEVDVGIFGLLRVLARGSRAGIEVATDLAGYTTQDLVTMANQGCAIGEEASLCMTAVAKMMMEHDSSAGPLQPVGVGAVVNLLNDLQGAASLILANATYELEQRGYTASGKYLASAKPN